MQLIRTHQVKCIEGDYDGLPTTRSKLVLPYTNTNIIPNGIHGEKNKTRDIQCGVQVCMW